MIVPITQSLPRTSQIRKGTTKKTLNPKPGLGFDYKKAKNPKPGVGFRVLWLWVPALLLFEARAEGSPTPAG